MAITQEPESTSKAAPYPYPRAELWEAAYRLLEQSVVAQQLVTWIQPLNLTEAEQRGPGEVRIHFRAPNDFSAQWVRDNHLGAMRDAFSQITGAHCEILIAGDEGNEGATPSTESVSTPAHGSASATGRSSESPINLVNFSGSPAFSSASLLGSGNPFGNGPGSGSLTSPAPSSPSSASSPSMMSDIRDSVAQALGGHGSSAASPPDRASNSHYGQVAAPSPAPVRAVQSSSEHSLDPRYVFENFVVGASNQFAHASAVAVAEQPARQYNPLFLYSPPGLGKTHLLHAIGNYLIAHKPGARVAYLSAEKFVNELIESLQHRKMSQFRTKFRDSFDLILIDDIQFIAGKNTSEEEFFHTFNALHSSKRQIVVTSDRPPKEIEGLEERVRTRFEWGLVADITPPEIETRIAILKTKAERDDIYLPDDVATFLASCIKSNVRELEGTLIKLQAQASLTGAEISLEMAKHELRNAIPEEGASFTIESIQNAVSKHFHIRIPDLKSTTRARAVALPRQIGMYLIRKYTGMGFREIGQHFGGKDHTTILHACSKIEKGTDTDPSIRDAVEAIQNML